MTSDPARCVNPGEITADDLTAYALGEAPPAVTRHLDHCPACRAEIRASTRVERLLRSAFFRRSCPESLTLGEYVLDLLSPERRQEIAGHLVECPHCLAERNSFREFLARDDDVLVLARNVAAAIAGAVAGFARRVLAAPDAPLAPALGGLRGGGATESVTYTASGLHLTISVQRATRGGRGSVVVGLIEEASGSPGTIAELYTGEDLVQQQPVDDLGNFLFNDVPAGTYRIEVTVPDVIVVIDPLEVT